MGESKICRELRELGFWFYPMTVTVVVARKRGKDSNSSQANRHKKVQDGEGKGFAVFCIKSTAFCSCTISGVLAIQAWLKDLNIYS